MDQDASLLNNHMARCRCSRSHFTRVGMPIIFMMIIILVVGNVIMPLVSQRYNDGRNVGVNEEGRDCCWKESDKGSSKNGSSKGGREYISKNLVFQRILFDTRIMAHDTPSNVQDEPNAWVHDTDCDDCKRYNLKNGRPFIKVNNKRNGKYKWVGCCVLVRVHPRHNNIVPTGEDLSKKKREGTYRNTLSRRARWSTIMKPAATRFCENPSQTIQQQQQQKLV